MTEAGAFRVCESVASCAGFTYSTPAAPAERRQLKHTIHFKTSGVGASGAEGWHSWVRSKTAQLCGAANKAIIANLTAPLRLRVDVLRESPPVFVVHDFATEAECEAMMDPTLAPTPTLTLTLALTLTLTLTLTTDPDPNQVRSDDGPDPAAHDTLRRLGRGHVAGAPVLLDQHATYPAIYQPTPRYLSPQARQSFSTNMLPDWSDELDTVTRIARRKFAFAREVGEYASLVEGPGQEPVSSGFYNPNPNSNPKP